MTKYILDCDTGVDDTLAIALGMGIAGDKVLAVVSSYGMAPLDYTNRNTKYVVQLLNKTQIPIIAGANKPLVRERKYGGMFHGLDGVGNTLEEKGLEEGVQSNIEQIAELIDDEAENEVILVTTGPLTTLARLIKDYAKSVERLKDIVIMGGAVTTEGNASVFAEANLSIDPEASNEVLTSRFHKTLVPLDVTRKTLLQKDTVNQWLNTDTEIAQFYGKAFNYYLNAYKKAYPYLKGCALHDPLAVAIAMKSELIKNSFDMNLRADLKEETKGWTVENLEKIEDTKTTTVVLDIHLSDFQRLFADTIHFSK